MNNDDDWAKYVIDSPIRPQSADSAKVKANIAHDRNRRKARKIIMTEIKRRGTYKWLGLQQEQINASIERLANDKKLLKRLWTKLKP